jgi:hypothetical protein
MKLIRRLTLAALFLMPAVAVAATDSGKSCCGSPCCASACPFCPR